MNTLLSLLHYAGLAIVALFLVQSVILILVATLTLLLRPSILGLILSDLRAIRERDPAAEGWVAALCYPGWWALTLHRLLAHPLYLAGQRTLARLVNFGARLLTGTDIHPGAQFGRGIFIDHAHGVVIGETAIVGNDVTILHQVTLGGTGKEHGKRHPTIEDGVLLSAGSKILGNITVGQNAKVGSGSVVVKDVPHDSTVVGVPGRVVIQGGKKIPSLTLDQTNLPDPLVERLKDLQDELRSWERQVSVNQQRITELFGGKLPGDVLGEIVRYKQVEVAAARAELSLAALRAQAGRRGPPRSFLQALRAPGLTLIAEIKKASPSGGLLREDFDPEAIARSYHAAGARALSVLTDRKYFQGDLGYLAAVRAQAPLPLLRKDFVIDEYQVVEAARAGADAILLIAAALDDERLKGLRESAEAEQLDALVEVHDEVELERALKSGARIVGINNRNLRTLETTLETTFRLLRELPSRELRGDLVVVSESGIKTHEDIRRLEDAGLDAVLIGETFMRAPDIVAKVHELMGVGQYMI